MVTTKGTRLQGLPVEVLAAFLQQLDDFTDLKHAVLTCRAWHQAHKAFPQTNARIWANKVSPDVLPWTIAALTTGRRRRRWFPYVHPSHALAPFLDNRHEFVTNIMSSMPNAAYAELERLHDVMHWYFEEFITSSLMKWDPMLSFRYFHEHPLSQSETSRVYRAFYRLQVYCNVFRFAGRGNATFAKMARFFDDESPWVNEQMVVARQVLGKDLGQFQELVPRLNGIKEITEMLSSSPNWNFIVEDLKDDGPDYVFPFLNVKSSTSLAKKIIKGFGRDGLDLLTSLDGEAVHIRYLFEHSEEEIDAMSKSHGECDIDQGPFEAWFALHTFQQNSRFCALFEIMHPREMGYVMWDKERLDRDAFLTKCQENWETNDRFRPMTDGRTRDFPLASRYKWWRDEKELHDWHGNGTLGVDDGWNNF